MGASSPTPFLLGGIKMLDEKNRLKRKNLKLKEENDELREKIKSLEKDLSYYSERVIYLDEKERILDEKEKNYNDLLTHVKIQQSEYQRIINEAKKLKAEIIKYKK